MRTLLLILPLIMAAAAFSQAPPAIEPGVSQTLAQWRAAHYSDVRYKLNLTLEKMSPVLKGTMEIHVSVASASADAPTPIILDWRKIAGHEKDSTILNVTLNGIAMDGLDGEGIKLDEKHYFIDDSDHLIFHDGVVPGENVIKLDFTSPILTSGSAITRYVDKEDGAEYIYSLFVPSDASTAFPVFDQPDLKARFELALNAPGSWKVVSNSAGGQYGVTDCPTVILPPQCLQTFRFEETKPISTYVFAFAAGPFTEFSGITDQRKEQAESQRKLQSSGISADFAFDSVLRLKAPNAPAEESINVYVRKSQAKKFESHDTEVVRLTREAVKYLQTYFDYKFPFPKYDLVLIPEFPFGGMEHAGATFLRESSVIFPTEPTKGDYISRANLIFHETAHQWFGDTVTMRWFDDLWLKEGFAEFMAYKTLEKVMPEANAWKVFYERNKQAAYATDSTKGTTPIYQKIDNLSAAKSAYGNIVYRKAPSFLRQAEFYLGEDKFQTAVRAFLKKHEYANAGWGDLVQEFQNATFESKRAGRDYQELSLDERKDYKDFETSQLTDWAEKWVKGRGVPVVRTSADLLQSRFTPEWSIDLYRETESGFVPENFSQTNFVDQNLDLSQKINVLKTFANTDRRSITTYLGSRRFFQKKTEGNPYWDAPGIVALSTETEEKAKLERRKSLFIFPNYQDYGYGIFLLDDKSREYVLKNIQNEKGPFLRSMMWGALWDSVREGEMVPREYVELVIKQLGGEDAKARASGRAIRDRSPIETDETIIQSILGRVSTALNYYLPAPSIALANARASASRDDLNARLEAVLLDRMQHAPTAGQRITFYRAFVNNASTLQSRAVLKEMLAQGVSTTAAAKPATPPEQGGEHGKTQASSLRSDTPTLRTKDKFDIVTRLIILGDPEAAKRLAELEKTETGDDAKRYAYAAHAAFGTAENKARFWNDFVSNKDISESWIEAALPIFNSVRQADLTQGYLERALAELPALKRTRKIFFVNNWLAAWIGGQRDERALGVVNKFLADNPKLDNDLRLKILENVDLIERAVKIRSRFH